MQTVHLNDVLMTYTETGDPEAPSLLLLSGWCQDRRLFKSLAPLLAERFHVMCLDWRGHDPKQTDGGDFSALDLADDLLAFIDFKGLDSVRLVSTSHGCWVNLEVCERLGSKRLPKTVVVDWLMHPHEGFWQQLAQGQHPTDYATGRQSFFDEWAASTDNADVLEHLRHEMPWFDGAMWRRACREIEICYRRWGSPLERMSSIADKPLVRHIYSQPLDPGYRRMQQDFAAEHSWFDPCHIPGNTHFPTLENPQAVARAIDEFFCA